MLSVGRRRPVSQAGNLAMKAKVIILNSSFQLARAQTGNDLAFSFKIPHDSSISLADELEVDLEKLGVEQDASNLSTGKRLRLRIEPFNVHDLKLPHARLHPPALARRRGAPHHRAGGAEVHAPP